MKKISYYFCIMVFSVLFAVSAFVVVRQLWEESKARNLYDSLAQQTTQQTDGLTMVGDKAVLPEYAALYQQNQHMVGWITVPDMKINYPVVQTPEQPNYYLHRDFNGNEAACGCPYVQENCDVDKPSDNLIIYAHNMKNGTMFGELDKFQRKDFWDTHRTLSFDTLAEKRTYEIVSVFKTVAESDSPVAFPYYQFVDAEGEEAFDAFVERSKELSLYDTGVSAVYGDKLITLSTCEYSRKNGRLILLAKQVEPDEP